jgi:hypothetical protein
VQVTRAELPARQRVGEAVTLRVRIRNVGARTLPLAAVAIATRAGAGPASPGFGTRRADPRLADANRPVWVLARGPAEGATAYDATWAVGPLRPGASRVLTWRLVPSIPGRYAVSYVLTPGLDGRARAAGGLRTRGTLPVVIGEGTGRALRPRAPRRAPPPARTRRG